MLSVGENVREIVINRKEFYEIRFNPITDQSCGESSDVNTRRFSKGLSVNPESKDPIQTIMEICIVAVSNL